MTTKQVTAKDLSEKIVPDGFDWIKEDETLKAFDALLSQARQEARREALKEMDEAYGFTLANKSDASKLLKLRQEYK
jgi:hypothetical protein